MANVTFYHQERVDGGRRTGITVDGGSVLHGFIPGDPDNENSALAWYVDLSVETQSPPSRDSAGVWLVAHWEDFRTALRHAGQELNCGLDVDTTPWEFAHPGVAGSIRVSVSAMRRLTALAVGDKLNQLAARASTELFPAFQSQP